MNRNFDHLNYVYEFKGDSDVSIDTSFVENYLDIQNETLEHTPSKTVVYSKYPKGFEILIEQFASKIIFYTNFPLIETAHGKYEIQFH